MTHGLIPHPAGAAVQGPTSTLCAELLRMIRRESAGGFDRLSRRMCASNPARKRAGIFICSRSSDRPEHRSSNPEGRRFDASRLHRCAPYEGARTIAGHLAAKVPDAAAPTRLSVRQAECNPGAAYFDISRRPHGRLFL